MCVTQMKNTILKNYLKKNILTMYYLDLVFLFELEMK